MYQLIHKLGAGGMGEVYAAHKQAQPKPLPVAVKILRPELAKFEQLVDLFNKEAVTAWRINHEHMHLVTVYDFGVMDDGIPYLIMEKVDGVRLDYLERDPGTEYRAIRRIAYDLLTALEHLHAHGLIHRDVTPRNVLIATNGVVKLTDLGLVKEYHGSLTGCFAGTPAYSSPEALQCRRMTPASDLYSLGVVLYERMTGGKPWGEGRPDDILVAMCGGERLPLPDNVPQDLADLVDVLMEFDSERRIQTAGEAIEMLDGPIAEDSDLAAVVARSPHPEPDPHVPELAYPFHARADTKPASAPEPQHRNSLAAIVLACALVLGGIGLGFGLGHTNYRGGSAIPTTNAANVATDTSAVRKTEEQAIPNTPTTMPPTDNPTAIPLTDEPTPITSIVVENPANADQSSPKHDPRLSHARRGRFQYSTTWPSR